MAFDITRRLFLRGAAVAAPMLAVPTAAAVASSYAEENAALLALEPELDAVIASSVAAKAAYLEARRIGESLWPRAPALITYDGKYNNRETGITGHWIDDGTCVHSESDLRYDLKCLMRKRKITPQVEEDRTRARQRLELREAYDAECAWAKEVSNYAAASSRWDESIKELFPVVGRVQSEPCKTMAGIRLKAKALDGWDKNVRHFDRVVNVEGRDRWMPDFCQSLIMVLES